jgi:hypothetical protein
MLGAALPNIDRKPQRAAARAGAVSKGALVDELIKQVSERTGLGEEKAREAVATVVDFLKARLPEPIAAHVDTALGSQQASDALGNIAGRLGGMFGSE